MFLGPSLFTGLAAGAAAAGWWLLAGLVLAGILAAVAPATSIRPELRASVLLWLGVVSARAFGAYVVPEREALAAAVVVVVATAAVAFGAQLSTSSRGLIAGLLVVVAAGFAAICFGIDPPPSSGDTGWGPLGALAAAGLFLAPIVLLRDRTRVVIGVGAAVAVAAGALYQLGPARLGLSDVPLRDALAAADAATLVTMLSAVVVVATLPAVFAAVADASAALPETVQKPWLRTVAVGAGTTAAAALVPAPIALIIASAAVVLAVVWEWGRKVIPRTS